jgi:hypothetical protein
MVDPGLAVNRRIGGHRIRTQCPRSGAAWAGWGPQPHTHLLAREFRIPVSKGDFQAARWTVMPAPAGTTGHHAGQLWVAATPGCTPFMDIKYCLTVSGMVSGPDQRGWLTEPQSPTIASIVSRRAGRCSDLACDTGTPIRRGVRIRRTRRASTRSSWYRQPS